MIIATASANVDDVVAADARNDELGGNGVFHEFHGTSADNGTIDFYR